MGEAFAWLTAQGLLIPALDSNASAGWMILSRRAERFESRAEFLSYASARRLPRELLHPTLKQGVWLSFVRGRVRRRGSKAMRRSRLPSVKRQASPQASTACPMIGLGVSQGKRAASASRAGARARGIHAPLRRALGSDKNLHSHRHVPMENARGSDRDRHAREPPVAHRGRAARPSPHERVSPPVAHCRLDWRSPKGSTHDRPDHAPADACPRRARADRGAGLANHPNPVDIYNAIRDALLDGDRANRAEEV